MFLLVSDPLQGKLKKKKMWTTPSSAHRSSMLNTSPQGRKQCVIISPVICCSMKVLYSVHDISGCPIYQNKA